ncbi:hypothetical protein FNU79_02330 [Deinococcus detaillensis]|uniref:Uncharacterized protein n=1 Tax=Deinococcus detaillensis TaxID=2592048 RepID=A0A553V6M4_9DEIO|nr:hypothetical protein [Deinococcus detaillensis]TSA88084.1 hypothetical protein FNU79_02330 [Deinococcus detaillensis]
MKRLLPILPFAAIMMSCNQTYQPVPIDFNSDSRILRGTWGGTVYDGRNFEKREADFPKISPTVGKQIKLQLNAMYINQSMYKLSGTALVGTESYQIQGEVEGKETHRYLKSQGRLRLDSEVNLRLLSSNKIAYSMHCWYYDPETAPSKSNIRCEGVDGVYPIPETFPDGIYPGWRMQLSREGNS